MGNKSANMLKQKKIAIVFTSFSLSIASAAIFSSLNKGLIKITGATCSHSHVEEYNAFAPTSLSFGEMHHYACCECHSAWQDSGLTIEIGNTVTDRSNILINKKTTTTEISKATVDLDDDIVNITNENPYVVGLDQTNWTLYNNGAGAGEFKYYQIDDKKAVRISAEETNNTRISALDTLNHGYSEFQFDKDIHGKPMVSFDYKIYDLDVSKYNNEPRMQIQWLNGNETVFASELSFITDNLWHTYNMSTNTTLETTSLRIRIHHFHGELYLSNVNINTSVLDAPVIRQVGYGIEFNSVPHADYYIVHDTNNNPNEITISDEEKVNGVLSYYPKVAGLHNLYVTAHSNHESTASSISNIINNLEISPKFFYDNFANEYYVKKDYFESKTGLSGMITGHELYKNKNKFSLNDDGSYYHAYFSEAGEFTQNASDRIEYTTYQEGRNLYRIIEEAKELGTNVLYVPHTDGLQKAGTTLNQNAELKAIMDAAYLNNLKVVVLAEDIYGPSASGNDESIIRTSVNNYLNNNGLATITHPAFYGFALMDEPRFDDNGKNTIQSVSYTAKACLDYFNTYYNSKHLTVRRPFFLCAFLQYTNSATGLFNNQDTYKSYVETWLTITGLNYYSSDIYTYTTQKYGDDCPEIIDDNYRIFLDLKNKYKGLKLHLTVSSNNDIDNRASCNVYDIFGSTLYSAAFNNYGISRYTYFPAIWTYHWKNGVVNRDGTKTDKYNWISSAQRQFEFIQNKLQGYEVTSFSSSTSGSYGASKANTRTMDIELEKGNLKCNVAINYNSQSNYNSQYKKFVPSGETYYLFGEGKTITPIISSGDTVTLNNGQAILIVEEEPSIRDIVMSSRDFVSNFGAIGSDCSDMNVNANGNTLKLTITGSAPGVWLNRELNGVDTFKDILLASEGFDVIYRASAGKTAAIRTVFKVGDTYPSKTYQGTTTTGDWDTISIRDFNTSLDAIRLDFLGTFASSGQMIEIKEIIFKNVDGPYFTCEAKYNATYIDRLSQISGFGSATSVTINSNNQYETDMTYEKDAFDSYIFRFTYSYQQNIDSLFFFVGCAGWKGFEFVILSNKKTQIDVYSEDLQYLAGSNQSLYQLDANTQYDMEFHIVRLYDGSNKVFLGIAVNGMFWNQLLIDDPTGCQNNVIGIYDYGANSGQGTVLSDYRGSN